MCQALQKDFTVFEEHKLTVIVSWNVWMVGIVDVNTPVVDGDLFMYCYVTHKTCAFLMFFLC